MGRRIGRKSLPHRGRIDPQPLLEGCRLVPVGTRGGTRHTGSVACRHGFARSILPRNGVVVQGRLPCPDPCAGDGLGVHSRWEPHADPCADRIGKDPRCLPLGHRSIGQRPPSSARPTVSDSLHLPLEGLGVRRRSKPQGTPHRHSVRGIPLRNRHGSGLGRHAVRRYIPTGTPSDAPESS